MKFIFWCAFDHLDFRIPEFEAIAEMTLALKAKDLKWIDKNMTHPWVILDLPDEESAKKICSRSISTKFCARLWVESDKGRNELNERLKRYCSDNGLEFGPQVSFKIQVETFMKRINMEERLQRIENFDFLPVKGPVKLQGPDVTFVAFEFYGFDHNNLPDQPLKMFFGQWVADGQRDLIPK